jgi:endonuclease V-like protein UPF0215 family
LPKKEIRLLGLSLVKKELALLVVGVVFRGNLWLDGIISSVTETNDQIASVSRTIKRSKQYSQLRSIMLMKQDLISSRELGQLADAIDIPVIAFSKAPHHAKQMAEVQPATSHYDLVVNGKHMSVIAAGIEKKEAEKIVTIGCKPGASVPEAVRVADLVMNEMSVRYEQALRR